MPSTDRIPPDSAVQPGRRPPHNGAAAKLATQLRHQASRLLDQASKQAGQLADKGKNQLAVKLDDVSGIVTSVAGPAEESYGPAVGRYVHRAAGSLSSAAEGLRSRSVHGLVSESRGLIQRNAGVALGTAAVIGFAAARIAKGGMQETDAEGSTPTQPYRDDALQGAFA